MQRIELLLGFCNSFGRALGGFLEALGGRGACRRCLLMPEGVAQQRDGLIADVRRDVGSRFQLLDTGFRALDAAVGTGRFGGILGAGSGCGRLRRGV